MKNQFQLFSDRKMTAGLVLSGLFVISLIAFGIFFFRSPRLSLSEISNQSDLSLLAQTYYEMRDIESWQPRFAQKDQIDFLLGRLTENPSFTDWEDFLLLPSIDMKPDAVQALEFQNCLVQELSKSPYSPSVQKIRKLKPEKQFARLENVCRQIVSTQKDVALSRFFTATATPEEIRKDPNSLSARSVRLQNLFWNNGLEYYPPVVNGWLGVSWRSQRAWIRQFRKTMETDALPLLKWQNQARNFDSVRLTAPDAAKTQLPFDKSQSSHSFIRLRLAEQKGGSAGSLIFDGWTIRGTYSLFFCNASNGSAVREYYTGIQDSYIQLIPDSRQNLGARKLPKPNYQIYSDSTQKPLNIRDGRLSYKSPDVVRFLKQLGIPNGFAIRIKKISSSGFFSSIEIQYQLEHPDIPDWRSEVYSLALSSESQWEQLQTQTAERSQAGIKSLSEHIVKNMRSLKNFPCSILALKGSEQQNQTVVPVELEWKDEYRFTFGIQIDSDAVIRYYNQATAPQKDQLLNFIVSQEKELAPAAPFLSVDDLVLTDKAIEGRGRVSNAAFENSDGNNTVGESNHKSSVSKVLTFPFKLYSNGQFSMNVQPVLLALKSQPLKSQPPAPWGMTPEQVREQLTETLEKYYPALVSSTDLNVDRTSSGAVYFRVTLRIADFPDLPLGTWFVEETTRIEDQLAEAFAFNSDNQTSGIAFAVSEHWSKPYAHPRYGRIESRLYSWTPESTNGQLGRVYNTIKLVHSPVGFDWQEPLSVTDTGEWLLPDENQFADQMEPQFLDLCGETEKIMNWMFKSSERTAALSQSYSEETGEMRTEVELNPQFRIEVTPDTKTENWYQFQPIKFSMQLNLLKPMYFPFDIEAGKVHISATEIDWPQRYHLSSDKTFWLPVCGISSPRLDIDLSRKRFTASGSFTPPCVSLTPKEKDKSYKIDEYQSPSMDKEEYKQRFGVETQDPPKNPWGKLIRLDMNGMTDLNSKELGLGGEVYLLDGGCASAQGQFQPDKIQGRFSATMNPTTNQEEDDSATADSGAGSGSDSGDESEQTPIPFYFNGGLDWEPGNTLLDAKTNLLGFDGSGSVRYDSSGPKAVIGASAATPIVFFVPQVVSLDGDVSVDAKRFSVEGSGTLLHPWTSFLPTARYGARIWRQSSSDKGFRLFLEFVTVDGRKITFQKEYPHACAMDNEQLKKEIEAEIEKFQKSPDKSTTSATAAQGSQLEAIAQSWPEAQNPISGSPSDAKTSSGQNADSQMSEMARSLGQLNKSLPSKEIPQWESESKEENKLTICADMEAIEENGTIIYRDAVTKEVYFQLNKQDIGLSNSDKITNYLGTISRRDDKSGAIIQGSIDSFTSGQPTFRRIVCRSQTEVERVDLYTPDSSQYQAFNKLFPFDVSSPSESVLLQYINSVSIATHYLLEELDNERIDPPQRSKNVCWFDTQFSKSGDTLTFAQGVLPNVQESYCIIPHKIIELAERRTLLLEHMFNNNVSEQTVKGAEHFFCVAADFSEQGANWACALLSQKRNSPTSRLVFISPGQAKEELIFDDLSQKINLKRFLQYFSWLLTRYQLQDIPINSAQTELYLGDSGLVVLYEDPMAKTGRLYLLPERALDKADSPVTYLDYSEWVDWNSNSSRFLPSSLQTRQAREDFPFRDLAKQTALGWDRAMARDAKQWRASPMGLLTALAQKNRKEKSQSKE